MVVVDRGGRASPIGGLPAGAATTVDAVLNLNARHLVRARRAVIAARQRELERLETLHRGLSAQQRRRIAAAMVREAETAEFASALLMLAAALMRDERR